MPGFFARSSSLLGLDIGATGVRLLELAGTPDDCTLKSMARVAYSRIPDGDEGRDADLISAAIQQAIRQSGSKTRNAAVAIPASASITRTIRLPASLNHDELLARVEQEADQQLPYGLDELYWDFAINELAPDLPGLIEIVLVASRRDTVEHRIALAEHAGLRVKVLDVQTYAVENAVLAMNARTGSLPAVCGVLLVNQNTSWFSLIQTNGATVTYESGETAANRAEPLSQQLENSLHAHARAHPGIWPEVIYVGGEWARSVPDLTTLLNIPVSLVNPLAGMRLADPVRFNPLLADEAPTFLTACGLALRAFDP